MAARRCTICGINYPTSNFNCPIHTTPLDHLIDVDADIDWQYQVKRLQALLARQEEDAELIPDLPLAITVDGDHSTISSHDVIRAGINNQLLPGTLIQIDGRVYEVLEYSYQGRSYQIRPFETEVTDEALREWLA